MQGNRFNFLLARILPSSISGRILEDKILAITGCNSKPLRTQRQKACENNVLIDCTFGRKTLALVYLAGGPIVASAIAAETLKERVEKGA